MYLLTSKEGPVVCALGPTVLCTDRLCVDVCTAIRPCVDVCTDRLCVDVY